MSRKTWQLSVRLVYRGETVQEELPGFEGFVSNRLMSENYVIRVKGHIDGRYFAWCDELTVKHLDSGETVLIGAVQDQAALHGLLAQIRDLSIPLISLNLQGSTGSSNVDNLGNSLQDGTHTC